MEHTPAIITSLDLQLGGVVLILEKRLTSPLIRSALMFVRKLDFRVIIVVRNAAFQWTSGYEVCSVA